MESANLLVKLFTIGRCSTLQKADLERQLRHRMPDVGIAIFHGIEGMTLSSWKQDADADLRVVCRYVCCRAMKAQDKECHLIVIQFVGLRWLRCGSMIDPTLPRTEGP
eukprot:1148805-Pelagomonas_calceolata.AAC.3